MVWKKCPRKPLGIVSRKEPPREIAVTALNASRSKTAYCVHSPAFLTPLCTVFPLCRLQFGSMSDCSRQGSLEKKIPQGSKQVGNYLPIGDRFQRTYRCDLGQGWQGLPCAEQGNGMIEQVRGNFSFKAEMLLLQGLSISPFSAFKLDDAQPYCPIPCQLTTHF